MMLNNDARLRFGRVELRPAERRLLVDGKAAAIGARAFDLLLALVERRERLVTKNELLDLVWPDQIVEENNLPVHVSALRKALGAHAIATIPGRGYRFTLADDADTDRSFRPAAAGPADPATGPGPGDDASTAAAGGMNPPAPPATHNLPPETGPLFGRDAEVAALGELLAHQSLVSIVGGGGMGKTRLARAVAHTQAVRHAGGVWWVDLASATHDDQVVRIVAQVIAAPLGESGAAQQLARGFALRPPTLLVLDNCDQVAPGVAALAEALLDAAPDLRLLATSQLPLHLPTEQVWRLEALTVPPADATLDQARRHAAFALFEHRARASDQRFGFADSAAVGLAVDLCRRLDGNALAIEMAATRAPQIGLAALVERLGDRLKLLRASQHGLPARHASLRATLDWSCSLLGETDRVVLRRLAAFAGSFDLDCAQQVAADATLDEWTVLDALSLLVDHCLLQIEASDGPRYRLAETTRLYAAEQLAAAGESTSVTRRHREAMAAQAGRAIATVWTLTQDAFLARHGPDQADQQLAFDNACGAADAAAAAATGRMLTVLDHLRGIVAGTRERMAAAQTLLAQAPTGSRLRAELLDLVAPVSSIALPGIARLAIARERSAAWATIGDRHMHYLALRALAAELARAGLADETLACAGQLAGFEADADVDPLPPALLIEGAQVPFELAQYGIVTGAQASHEGAAGREGKTAAAAAGARDTAQRASAAGLWRALSLAQAMHDTRRTARLRYLLADEATAHGDPGEAIELCQAAIAAQQTLLRPAALGMAWSNLCAAQLLAGKNAAARSSAARALPLLRPQLYANVLFNHLALLAARGVQAELGARLLGHADRWYAANQTPMRQAIEAKTLALALPALAAALGAERVAALRAEGAALDDRTADALAAGLFDTSG